MLTPTGDLTRCAHRCYFIVAMTIKDIRQKSGLTQEQFAHKLGVTAYTIRRWESGKVQPSPLALQAINAFVHDMEGPTTTDNISSTPHQTSRSPNLTALRGKLGGLYTRIKNLSFFRRDITL